MLHMTLGVLRKRVSQGGTAGMAEGMILIVGACAGRRDVVNIPWFCQENLEIV